MHLVEVLFSFPTVAFTAPLVLCLFYWIFVLVGALDLDSGDAAGHGADGHADGALDGHADVGHGEPGHHHHDGGDGGDDGGADHADVDSDGFFATMMSALKLRKVPLTVRLSLLSFFGFLAAGFTSLSIDTSTWPVKIGVFFGAALVSVLLSAIAVRPLVPVFDARHASRHADLVGKIAVISTGSVNERFGQGIVDDGGAGVALHVRSDAANHLKKGDRVVIVEHDAERDTFLVEPLPDDRLHRRIEAAATAKGLSPEAELEPTTDEAANVSGSASAKS